jgi:Na+-translocating ferredoxin:NAD+ oxidoreductase subunit B
VTPLAGRLHQVLPQTQCKRCGYPDCAGYAQAIADNVAGIDQCPPGGAEGVRRLSALTGRAPGPVDPAYGVEGPRPVAVIDEDWCIGCTLCLEACPTDAILGGNKHMHTVIEPWCTGCELCIPVCPVDCISLVNVTGERTGWNSWTQEQADTALARYESRKARLARNALEVDARLQAKAEAKLDDLPGLTHGAEGAELDRKRAMIEAALARAKAKRGQA